MTSEKKLREIFAAEVILHLPSFNYLCDEYPNLTDEDRNRVYKLLETWPILNLPVPDRDGLWWPERGRNYGHVRLGSVRSDNDRVVISRGGPGEASHYTSMSLTKNEALELASILTAAATEES